MAVMKRPVPKDNPAPLSAIPYGDTVTVGELVYSLDKFRPRFPLRWQAIRLKQGDEFLPLTDDNMQKAVFDSIIYPLYTVMQQADGEQYWKDKNDENFKALDISNFSFSSLLVTSLSAVGGWFANLWDSLGPVTIIFTFPLTLGIALVVVGRVARSAGKGSKSDKGGDSDG